MTRALWIVWLVTGALYLAMLAWSLPHLTALAGGLPMFDMRPGGYSELDARALLTALGVDGRTFYLGVQHRLDTVFLALEALALALTFPRLFPRLLAGALIAVSLAGTVFDNFAVQYSTDSSFATGINTVGTYTFNQAACDLDSSCSISWTPGAADPIVPNKDYYLRVLDPDDTDTPSSSAGFGANQKFELAGDLALTVLTGANATYTVGQPYDITWTKKGSANGSIFDDVNLEYSTDSGFATSTAIASAVVINGAGTVCDGNGDCTKSWTIPNSTTVSNDFVYYVRVIDPNN